VLFLYKHVLRIDLPWLDDLVRARRSARLPVVLTRAEVAAVLAHLDGMRWMMAALLYGAGLRLLECLRLRVKDVDFGQNEIVVGAGKGDRDRRVMLPRTVEGQLVRHMLRVRALHDQDVERGAGWVKLPHALGGKYPNAGRQLAWQWVFLRRGCIDTPRRRGPPASLPRVRVAARREACRFGRSDPQAGGMSHVPALLRHPFAGDGYDIRTVQELLGHQDVRTNMIYTHVLNRGGRGVMSPVDRMVMGSDPRAEIGPRGRGGLSFPAERLSMRPASL
jgi:integrase